MIENSVVLVELSLCPGSAGLMIRSRPWRTRPSHPQGRGDYIVALPKKEAAEAEWQAAMECLILVAEKTGPTMFARIGIMRALNRHVERVFKAALVGGPLSVRILYVPLQREYHERA
jgi:hypothetical protein